MRIRTTLIALAGAATIAILGAGSAQANEKGSVDVDTASISGVAIWGGHDCGGLIAGSASETMVHIG